MASVGAGSPFQLPVDIEIGYETRAKPDSRGASTFIGTDCAEIIEVKELGIIIPPRIFWIVTVYLRNEPTSDPVMTWEAPVSPGNTAHVATSVLGHRCH